MSAALKLQSAVILHSAAPASFAAENRAGLRTNLGHPQVLEEKQACSLGSVGILRGSVNQKCLRRLPPPKPSPAPGFGVGFPLQHATRKKNISLTHHTLPCHDFLRKILGSGTQQSGTQTNTVTECPPDPTYPSVVVKPWHLATYPSLGGTASAVS